ncbi:unnamed protein product [Heligmosomoides polygyrus]|uniref:G_PROTEIN_RECEP_F1_2 domain-containing protein n=1 Tax=Heligmosomoides polygyrus TaxID=6339 RepID=A0A183FXD9_HELPZ|nr:unnamed protein product [Heligmosomoides polygyrus]
MHANASEFKKFEGDDFDLSNRPVAVDEERLPELVQENPQRAQHRELAEKLECLRTTIAGRENRMRHIYRSLIVISLTVVFGWFSTMLIGLVGEALQLKIERLYVNLLSGVFVNFACATNFFVYYTVSDEYRQEFDRYLNIGQLRKEVGFTTASDVKGNTVVTNRVEEGT